MYSIMREREMKVVFRELDAFMVYLVRLYFLPFLESLATFITHSEMEFFLFDENDVDISENIRTYTCTSVSRKFVIIDRQQLRRFFSF